MTLTGSQLQKLYEALLSAFPSKESLERLVAFRFNTYLEQIVQGKDQKATVFDLVKWAETEGTVRELILAAREANSGNNKLNTVAEELLEPQARDEQAWEAYCEKYVRHLFFEHRHFDIKGLSARGQYNLALEKVFVELSMVSEVPGRAARNPISPVPAELQTGQHPIWDYLRCPPKETRNLAIIGSPGSGKTTLLKHIALLMHAGEEACKACNAPYKLPILLFLRDHARYIAAETKKKRYTLVQAARDNLDKFEGPEPPPDGFETALENGDCLVLLDGLDEVADVALRKKVVAWVEKQLVKHGNNSFVITSRPHGYENNPLERVNLLRVRHFNLEQQKQFIQNWCLATEIMANAGQQDEGVERDARRKAKDLLTRLQNNAALSELAVYPLLLTLITQVHHYRNSLPGRRVELYQEVCDVFLGKRREALGIVDDITPIQKQLILQPLAYAMMRRKFREIPTQDAIVIITESLRKVSLDVAPATFLKAIEDGSGLLLERENEEYAFAHLTFQEFLTAVHIEKQRLDSELKRHVKNSWWHETIRLYSARSKDATPILQACLDTEDIDALALATECVDDGCLTQPELRKQIDHLVTTQADSVDEKERRISAEILLRRRLHSMARIDDNRYVDNRLVSNAEYQLFLDEKYEQHRYHQPDHWMRGMFLIDTGLTPIVGVRPSDVGAFCKWLTDRDDKEGWYYRLPKPDKTENGELAQDTLHTGYWTLTEANEAHCEREGKLCAFLTQVQLKRCFDADLARDIDRARSRDLDLARARARARNLDLALARADNLDIALNLTHARDLAHDLALELDLARDLALDVELDRDLVRDRDLKITELCSLLRWSARIFILGYGPERFPREWANIYISLVILEERIAGNLPAFEGIRIVRERVQP